MERKILIEGQLAQIQPSTPLEGISGEKIVTPEEKTGKPQNRAYNAANPGF